jgi:hypothetical protein
MQCKGGGAIRNHERSSDTKGLCATAQEELKKFQKYLAQIQNSCARRSKNRKVQLEALEPERKRLCPSEQAMIPSRKKKQKTGVAFGRCERCAPAGAGQQLRRE